MNTVLGVLKLGFTARLLLICYFVSLFMFNAAVSVAATGDSMSPEVIASGQLGAGISINSLGEVVWAQMLPTGTSQVFSSTRGQLTTDSTGYNNIAINNLGDMVWVERSNSYPYTYHIHGNIAGQQVTVATSQNWIVKIDLNDRGEVVWATPDSNGYHQIFSSIRGQLTSGSYYNFDPSINNQGDIHDKFCQGENGDFP